MADDKDDITIGSFATKDSGKRMEFSSGMKRDTEEGKTLYHLVFDGPLLKRWAELLTRGAKKYDEGNWLKAVGQAELTRFRKSAARHFFQWMGGLRDEDHAAAVIFNMNGAEHVREKLDTGRVPLWQKVLRDTKDAEALADRFANAKDGDMVLLEKAMPHRPLPAPKALPHGYGGATQEQLDSLTATVNEGLASLHKDFQVILPTHVSRLGIDIPYSDTPEGIVERLGGDSALADYRRVPDECLDAASYLDPEKADRCFAANDKLAAPEASRIVKTFQSIPYEAPTFEVVAHDPTAQAYADVLALVMNHYATQTSFAELLRRRREEAVGDFAAAVEARVWDMPESFKTEDYMRGRVTAAGLDAGAFIDYPLILNPNPGLGKRIVKLVDRLKYKVAKAFAALAAETDMLALIDEYHERTDVEDEDGMND